MKLELGTAVGKLLYTVAAASVIGGGSVVLTSASRISVLEKAEQTSDRRLERIENKIDRLVERSAPGGSRE